MHLAIAKCDFIYFNFVSDLLDGKLSYCTTLCVSSNIGRLKALPSLLAEPHCAAEGMCLCLRIRFSREGSIPKIDASLLTALSYSKIDQNVGCELLPRIQTSRLGIVICFDCFCVYAGEGWHLVLFEKQFTVS